MLSHSLLSADGAGNTVNRSVVEILSYRQVLGSRVRTYTGLVAFLESFGKLWKLIMLFSRTWKVLETKGFSKLLWKSFWVFVGEVSTMS